MAGGSALGAVGGATFGTGASVAEGAHLEALGGLAVADAAFGGTIAGTVVGDALGAVGGGLIIGGMYVTNRFNTGPLTSRSGTPINACP
jgi:hypothetical protein